LPCEDVGGRESPTKEIRHERIASASHAAKWCEIARWPVSPRNPDNTGETRLPPAVNFTTGAALLVKLKIVDSITREGVRHIATSERYEKHWPFGPDKEHPYGEASGALWMATEPFLEFFRTVYNRLDVNGDLPHEEGGER
jgi:hypothetical protein